MAVTTAAQRAKAKKFIRELDSVFLDCRRYGHAWRNQVVYKYGRSYVQSLICDRCSARKEEFIDHTGALERVVTTYPQGYLARGTGYAVSTNKAALRIAVIERVGYHEV